jgi:hypothetical protein
VSLRVCDAQERDVADLWREAAQGAERDERRDGQAGALHVLRDRRGERMRAAEGQSCEHQR